jgi:hypothetical protein
MARLARLSPSVFERAALIDNRVYQWPRYGSGFSKSRTSHGGRQLPLIAPPPEGGCFRWGMCEAPSEKGEP